MPEVLEIEARLKNFISGNIKKIQGDLKGLEHTAKKSLSASDRAAKEFSGSIKSIATRFGPAAIAVGVFAKATMALTGAINDLKVATTGLEKEMSAVKAILVPTGDEFIQLEKKARQLGQTTVFTATQSAKAFTEMGKRGFEAAQIIAASSGVLDLAAATMSEMSVAAQTTVATLNQFDLAADESRRVVDLMTKSFNTSALDMFNFGEAMKMVGPIAGTIGTPLEEVTSALAVLADREIKASLAGTGMRRILLELADSSSKVSQAIDDSGETANTLTEKLKVLSRMNLTTGQTTEFFTIRAVAAASILLKNVDVMEDLNKEYLDAEGSAKRMAEVMLDNVAGATTLLKSAQEELGITIGEAFSDEKRQRIENAIVRTKEWTKFLDQNKVALERISKWLSAVIEFGVLAMDKALKILTVTIIGLATPIDRTANFFKSLFGIETLNNIENINDALTDQEKKVQSLSDAFAKQEKRNKLQKQIKSQKDFDKDTEAEEEARKKLLKSREVLADATISIIENETEREVAKVKEKFSRLIATAKGSSGAIANLRKAEAIETEKVIEDILLKELESYKKSKDKIREEQQKSNDKILEEAKRAAQQQADAEKTLRNLTIQFLEEGGDKQLAIFDAQTTDIIDGLVAREETITAIKTAAEQERKELLDEIAEQKKQDDIQRAIDVAAQVIGAANQVASGIIGLSRQSRLQELSDEKERINAMKITQKEKEKLLKRAEAANREKAKKEKGIAIGQAIVNTALGVTGALSTKPTALGIVLAALVGAAGAIEIATIASQKFAGGGIVGGSTMGDKNIIAANANEVVLNPRQQAELLFNIANGGGGGGDSSLNISFNVASGANLDNDAADRIAGSIDNLGKALEDANRAGTLNDFKEQLRTEGVF